MGEATLFFSASACTLGYFNPRFPWGKRRFGYIYEKIYTRISIHASRGGSDNIGASLFATPQYFNPRFPWGKRRKHDRGLYITKNFNPRFPWGKRHADAAEADEDAEISIHASRGGSDQTLLFSP